MRIFPENFRHKGGGYRPDIFSSEPFKTETYRKDDLLFGRACWLPATMIPWSHRPQSDIKQQRLDRLTAQHFYLPMVIKEIGMVLIMVQL